MQVLSVPLVAVILLVAAALWVTGLRLFLRAELTERRKILWSGVLIAVGLGIGAVLPLREVFTRFLLMMAVVPVLAVVDVVLLKSRRGVSYWIRACGFEVGTVFAVAAAARWAFDLAGVRAVFEHGG